MEYLLRVQKAIALTFKPAPYGVPDEYFLGWDEAEQDLKYGLSLGSDHAVMQQIKYWTDWSDPLYVEVFNKNKGDQGYAARMKEIHKLIEENYCE